MCLKQKEKMVLKGDIMRKLLEKFFQHYLTERNLEATLAVLTEDVVTVGTGEQEISRNKEELRELLLSEFEELPNALEYEICDYMQNFSGGGSICTQLAVFNIRLKAENEITEIHSRLTSTCVKDGNEWKIASLHMSTPEHDQEKGAFFPLYYGKSVVGTLSKESEEKLTELVTNALPGGIMGGYLEEGYPLYTINNKMLEILGYTYEELIAVTDEKMMNVIYTADQQRVEESIVEQIQEKNEYEIVYRVVGKNDRLIWVNDIGRKIITNDGREAMISIMTDITEQLKREEMLKYEAGYDSLTGLNNRKNAVSLMEKEFNRKAGGYFFICDIDNFKSVNDTKGHLFGDNVLIKLADIMRKKASDKSILARLGGDEYILFFPADINKKDVMNIMQGIQKEFLSYMREIIPELNVSLSIGGTERTANEDTKTLYDRADKALYQAKNQKGELRLYEQTI